MRNLCVDCHPWLGLCVAGQSNVKSGICDGNIPNKHRCNGSGDSTNLSLAQINKNTKVLSHLSLWGEFTGNGKISNDDWKLYIFWDLYFTWLHIGTWQSKIVSLMGSLHSPCEFGEVNRCRNQNIMTLNVGFSLFSRRTDFRLLRTECLNLSYRALLSSYSKYDHSVNMQMYLSVFKLRHANIAKLK